MLKTFLLALSRTATTSQAKGIFRPLTESCLSTSLPTWALPSVTSVRRLFVTRELLFLIFPSIHRYSMSSFFVEGYVVTGSLQSEGQNYAAPVWWSYFKVMFLLFHSSPMYRNCRIDTYPVHSPPYPQIFVVSWPIYWSQDISFRWLGESSHWVYQVGGAFFFTTTSEE